MIKEATKKVSTGQDLTADEMTRAFNEVMNGTAEKGDVKSFLLSLKEKGESSDEIFAAAKVMREKAIKVDVSTDNLIDTCGTGGADVCDINVSTVTALVLAGCGMKVAKHGNRSFSGKCGSADILEAFGVNIEAGPEKVAKMIREIGMAFIFAKNYHPAMKNVMGIRKELATRTIFNILGPLSNPAGAKMQILGVYKPEMTELMVEALNKLGSERACVVHGMKGLDEISIEGPTRVSELKAGSVSTYTVSPADFDLPEGEIKNVRGGMPEDNKEIILDILKGKDNGEPRNMVLMNAAMALRMADKVLDLKEGVNAAAGCIDSGKALNVLERLREMSNE